MFDGCSLRYARVATAHQNPDRIEGGWRHSAHTHLSPLWLTERTDTPRRNVRPCPQAHHNQGEATIATRDS
jgi:hypothetical protein